MLYKMGIKSNSSIIVGCCAIIISETNTLCVIIVCFYLPSVAAFNSFFLYPIIIQGQRAFNTFLCCSKMRIIVFATSSLSRSFLRINYVLQPGGNHRQKNMNTCSWMLTFLFKLMAFVQKQKQFSLIVAKLYVHRLWNTKTLVCQH